MPSRRMLADDLVDGGVSIPGLPREETPGCSPDRPTRRKLKRKPRRIGRYCVFYPAPMPPLITVCLEVRILPGPPCTPVRTGVSWSLTNSPQFAGVSAVQIPRMRSLPRMKTARRWFGAFRLWRPKSVSRCAEKAAARDSVRMRQRPVRIQEIGEELDWDMVGRLPPG